MKESRSQTRIRDLFAEGYTCGECLIRAIDFPDRGARDTLIRAVQGLAKGRGVTCSLLLAGLLALSERRLQEGESQPVPCTDWLDALMPPTISELHETRRERDLSEFRRQFESRAAARIGGLRCQMTFTSDDPGSRLSGFSQAQEGCIELAERTSEDLNVLLGRHQGFSSSVQG